MRNALFMVILLAAATALAAENPPLITRWENFTTANGMPDDKVFCVAIDGARAWAGIASTRGENCADPDANGLLPPCPKIWSEADA